MPDETRVEVIPPQPSFQSERCPPHSTCILCKLTGRHNQSQPEKMALMKQATVGFMIMVVMLGIVGIAIALVFKMVL